MSEVTRVLALNVFFSQQKVGKCGEWCDYSEHFL